VKYSSTVSISVVLTVCVFVVRIVVGTVEYEIRVVRTVVGTTSVVDTVVVVVSVKEKSSVCVLVRYTSLVAVCVFVELWVIVIVCVILLVTVEGDRVNVEIRVEAGSVIVEAARVTVDGVGTTVIVEAG